MANSKNAVCRCGRGLIAAVKVTSGVPQGTVLGPLMFLLYINDIGDNLTPGTKIRLFADDCLLYREINSAEDQRILQKDLDSMIKWSNTWQMSFNPKKCFVVNVTNKKSIREANYSINSAALANVKHHPYLGVELDQQLSWRDHISSVTAKANKTLGFLRRNLSKCAEKVKERAYLTLVRPQLEYASACWDPAKKTQVAELEMVQRRAVRFVRCIHDRGETSISAVRDDLGWPTLETRRKIKRLSIFHKAVNNRLAVTINARPSGRTSRRDNSLRFVRPLTSSAAYADSFTPRTIRDWNGLPGCITNIDDSEDFKVAVSELLANNH